MSYGLNIEMHKQVSGEECRRGGGGCQEQGDCPVPAAPRGTAQLRARVWPAEGFSAVRSCSAEFCRCLGTGLAPCHPKALLKVWLWIPNPHAGASPLQLPGAPGSGGSVEEAARAGAQRQMDCLSFIFSFFFFLIPFSFPEARGVFSPFPGSPFVPALICFPSSDLSIQSSQALCQGN